MPNYLKSVGSQEDPIAANALDEPRVFRDIGFPRRGKPGVSIGDRLVLYATGYGRAFAIVQATSDPVWIDESGEERWPWRVRVRPLIVVPDVRSGATLAEGGVASASMKRRSHLRLTDAQYDGFVEGLTRVAA